MLVIAQKVEGILLKMKETKCTMKEKKEKDYQKGIECSLKALQ